LFEPIPNYEYAQVLINKSKKISLFDLVTRVLVMLYVEQNRCQGKAPTKADHLPTLLCKGHNFDELEPKLSV
jgi:hypothetical protein